MTIERARAAIDAQLPTSSSFENAAVIVLAAQFGIADHLRWQLAQTELARRQAEYNYASVMLEQAKKLATRPPAEV